MESSTQLSSDDRSKSQIKEEETNVFQMWKDLLKIAFPIIVGQVFSLFIEMFNLVFAGHLGDPLYVAAVGLGNMYANITCLLVIYGLNSAIASLASQAYGSGNLRKCGIYLNKGRIAILMFFVPIFIVMFMCEPFLLLLRIDAETARQAQNYTYGMIVALFFQSQFDATRQYLNALQKSQVITYMMIAASIYHLIILYITVHVLNWGMLGCSWGTVITYSINLIVVTIYCKTQEDLKESFFFPNRECFEDLWDYLRIGLPSSFMLSFEQWSYEIQAILASYISVLSVGAMAINVNFLTVIIMIPFGLSISSSVLVGKSMGEGSGKHALMYAKLTTATTFGILFVMSMSWIYFRLEVASFFSNSPELIEIVSSNSVYFAIFLLIHGTGLALGGAFRGMGKQSPATKIILLSFYLVGNPSSILFAFYFEIGMNGLTMGLICGTLTMTILYYIWLYFVYDWESISKDIRKRMIDETYQKKLEMKNAELSEALL